MANNFDYSVFFTDSKTAETYSLENQFAEHIELSLVKDKSTVTKEDAYNALAMAIRDRLIRRWLRTQRQYREHDAKRVYYLSLEYLMGRLLGNALNNMRYYEECAKILDDLGYKLDEIREVEHDMGLGNGGLGRLAACFLDSMATARIPAYAYGIRYEYGIFEQKIENGYQIEIPENWIAYRNPWEVVRPELTYRVKFGGSVQSAHMRSGETVHSWVDTDDVLAVAYDVPVPGYDNQVVNNLRLWQARSTQDLDFKLFQSGDYLAAVRRKSNSEAISKFLYPNDDNISGRVLRLKQQYFFVAATLQDIIRIHKRQHRDLTDFPEKLAIQLNDTHPSIAIPELMRILLDEERMPWDIAWDIVKRTFAYTNHTVMAEALERWPVQMMETLLPRHLQIIYEINDRFLGEVRRSYPGDVERLRRMSIVEEGPEKKVRMPHLAIAGSFKVNGVAELHTRILREKIFPDFDEMHPGKFVSITNGITQRRWLQKANPMLSQVITSRIGPGWATDLMQLKGLEKFAGEEEFTDAWMSAKWSCKHSLAGYIRETSGLAVDVNSMFDVHVKRIHEYKRQILNIIHVISFYNFIKDNPGSDFTPRTVLFAGKAAPGYRMAKLIIKLINSVSETINADPATNEVLRVLFLPNYSVSLAEKVIPAADLSEQISTAGTEASGTGNMKLALNGALTIGTMDGANIEMAREIGEDNMFIFGHTESEIEDMRSRGYEPMKFIEADERLARAVEMLRDDYFNWREPGIFAPIVESLTDGGDRFFVTADFAPYFETQRKAAALFKDKAEWARRSILNSARMGVFSSDRTIAEYSEKVWGVKPEDL